MVELRGPGVQALVLRYETILVVEGASVGYHGLVLHNVDVKALGLEED